MCNELNQTLLATLDPSVANKMIQLNAYCNTIQTLAAFVVFGFVVYIFVANT
jgi:hypothetical protein